MTDRSLIEIIRSRRSVRRFDLTRKVKYKQILELIDAANYAPSACNAQAWHFIVLDDQEIIENLIKSGLNKGKDSDVIIFVYYRKHVKSKYKNIFLDDYIESASAAIQNMMLRAEEMGLGACWINGINVKKLHKVIKKPFGYEFIAMIRVGYKKIDKSKIQPRKRSPEEIISYNNFSLPTDEIPKRIFVMMEEIILKNRILFYLLPKSLIDILTGKATIKKFKVN